MVFRQNVRLVLALFLGIGVVGASTSLAQINGPRVLEGTMTGGGSVFTDSNDLWVPQGTRVSHGFSLQCDQFKGPNNLQVQVHLPNGGGGRFHLDQLTFAWCWDDPGVDTKPRSTRFDTYFGAGTGRYNGVPGYCADWTFSDAGEPGSEDRIRSMRIWRPLNGDCAFEDGPFILSIYLEPGHTLLFGNHQAQGKDK